LSVNSSFIGITISAGYIFKLILDYYNHKTNQNVEVSAQIH
jgi:hypothetical protein